MPTIHERVTLYTTKPVLGQYRYEDKFQIYPSRRKPLKDGRFYYPLNIEIAFSQQGDHFFRFGFPYGSDQLTRQIVEFHHLLSLITQFYFFGMIKAKQPIENFSRRRCDQIEKGNIKWYQDKALDDLNVEAFILPEFVDTILRSYYSLSVDDLFVFRNACYLFYCALELRGSYASLSFAQFVSAIETLMAYEAPKPERCKSCNQPKFRLSARFREFILGFGYGNKGKKGANAFINRVYGLRSRILHDGQLLLCDMFWRTEGKDQDGQYDREKSFIHKDLLGVTRVCMINWLASRGRS